MNFKPYGQIGNKLNTGDWIRLVEIPPGIFKMPEEIHVVFEKTLDKTFRIEEFNKYGLLELNLTKKIVKFNTIWVEPRFLQLFRRVIKK